MKRFVGHVVSHFDGERNGSDAGSRFVIAVIGVALNVKRRKGQHATADAK